ncbi:hypothetical protein N5K55_17165 [Pseudomonas aeruginosa]|nr:hypothetical protein [Pseudomonas aeruginosa]
MLLQQFFLVVVHRGSPFVRLCLSAVDEEDDSGITARGPTEQEIRQTRRKRKAQGTTETKKKRPLAAFFVAHPASAW